MEVENRTKKEGVVAEQKERLNKEGMQVGETLLLDFQLEIGQTFSARRMNNQSKYQSWTFSSRQLIFWRHECISFILFLPAA